MEAILANVWFTLWGVLWAVYFITDGYDLGLGTILPWVSKSDRDKRVIYNAQGPFWDGNEVWLLTAGGVTFAALPKTYAAMFSALYTPLMLVLFMLILRGVTFEFRGKVDSDAWRSVWDWTHTVSSFALSLLFGVFFANLFMGVPFVMLDNDKFAQWELQGNLLTLLNPYGLAGGLLFVALFIEHGALWGVVHSEGGLKDRLAAVAKQAWVASLVLAVAFLGLSFVYTELWAAHFGRLWSLVFPLLAVVGLLVNIGMQLKKSYWLAWAGSALTIAMAAGFGVAGMFPYTMRSSLDTAATWAGEGIVHSLTASGTASSLLSMQVMLGVAGVAVPLVIGYQVWVSWVFRHPVTDEMLAEPESY